MRIPFPSRRRWSFLRFLIVGGGFSVGYSAIAALLVGRLGLPAYWTSLILYVFCVPLAYLAHKHFSFGAGSAKKGGLVRYVGLQIASFAFTAAISTRLVTGVYLVDMGIYFCTVGIAAGLTFLIANAFIFNVTDEATRRNAGSDRRPR